MSPHALQHQVPSLTASELSLTTSFHGPLCGASLCRLLHSVLHRLPGPPLSSVVLSCSAAQSSFSKRVPAAHYPPVDLLSSPWPTRHMTRSASVTALARLLLSPDHCSTLVSLLSWSCPHPPTSCLGTCPIQDTLPTERAAALLLSGPFQPDGGPGSLVPPTTSSTDPPLFPEFEKGLRGRKGVWTGGGWEEGRMSTQTTNADLWMSNLHSPGALGSQVSPALFV